MTLLVGASAQVLGAQEASLPFEKALADAKNAKDAGEPELAILTLLRARRQLATNPDPAYRASSLVVLDDRLGEYDSLAGDLAKAMRPVAVSYRKVADLYRSKGLPRLAADMAAVADQLDPIGVPTQPGSAKGSAKKGNNAAAGTSFRKHFSDGKDCYDAGTWIVEDHMLESPLPSNRSQLLLSSSPAAAGTRFRFEVLAPSGVGQVALAFGAQSLQNYYLYEVERFPKSTALNFIRIVEGRVEYLIREMHSVAKQSNTEWTNIEVLTRGPWLVARQGTHHVVAKAPTEDLSGRFGFFISGATTAKHAVQLRGLEVLEGSQRTSSLAPKGDASPDETLEALTASTLKATAGDDDLDALWKLRARGIEVEGPARKAFLSKVDKALVKHDPCELRRRQAARAFAQATLQFAKRYEQAGHVDVALEVLSWAALHAPQRVHEAQTAITKKRSASRAADEPNKNENKGDIEAQQAAVIVDTAMLLKEPAQPWGASTWTLSDASLVSPAALARGSSASLLSNFDLAWSRCSGELRLGLVGSLAFVFGFRSKDDFWALHFEHLDPTLTKASASHWNGKQWEVAFSMTTNAFAGEARPEWISFELAAQGEQIELRLGPIPTMSFRTESVVPPGKVGFYIATNSRGREPVQVRKLEILGKR